jgi:hypothetical protein
MHCDPTTGKTFRTAAELQAVQSRRRELIHRTQQAAAERAAAEAQRQHHRTQTWRGLGPGSAVLLTEHASAKLTRQALTRHGVIRLCGRVLAIEAGRASVVVRFRSRSGPQALQGFFERTDLELWPHDPMVWNLHRMADTAAQRSTQCDLKDQWRNLRSQSYWAEPDSA